MALQDGNSRRLSSTKAVKEPDTSQLASQISGRIVIRSLIDVHGLGDWRSAFVSPLDFAYSYMQRSRTHHYRSRHSHLRHGAYFPCRWIQLRPLGAAEVGGDLRLITTRLITMRLQPKLFLDLTRKIVRQSCRSRVNV
jgi:hypothetical protein